MFASKDYSNVLLGFRSEFFVIKRVLAIKSFFMFARVMYNECSITELFLFYGAGKR